MEKYVINGGTPLRGEVEISGAKNAAVAIIPAALMVRVGDEYKTITGNQLGVLLLDYIITARRADGTLPKNAGAVKSIVTTEMAREVCVKNGVHIEDTFTGFKFMTQAEKDAVDFANLNPKEGKNE